MNSNPPFLRHARFVMDGLGGPYEGFTSGETWNGWAVPYFTFSEAQRVVKDYATQPPGLDGPMQGEYDSRRRIFRIYDPSDDEWDEIEPIEIEGLLLYPVGDVLRDWWSSS